MSRVAVMGCGLGNVQFVRALTARGHEVAAFSWPGNTHDCDRLRSLRVRHVPLAAPLEITWDHEHPERDMETPLMRELAAGCRALGVRHLFGFAEVGVYALGLNRHLFEPYGTRLHVPDTDRLRPIQVRPEFARLCARHGITSPQVIGRLGDPPRSYPVVAKLPTSAGSAGVRIVRSPAELATLRRSWAGAARQARLYRYVAGDREPSLTVVFDDRGRPAIATWLRKIRYAGASMSTCVETTAEPPEAAVLLDFLGVLGLRGICSVQLKRERHSDVLHVLEINVRPGQNSRILVSLWDRLGLGWLDHVLGTAPAPPVPVVVPAGLLGLSPVEDAAAVLKHLLRRPGGRYRRRDVLASVWYSARRGPTIDAITPALAADLRSGPRIALRQFAQAYREPTDLIPYGELRNDHPASRPASPTPERPAGRPFGGESQWAPIRDRQN